MSRFRAGHCQICGEIVDRSSINCNLCSSWARRIFDHAHTRRVLDGISALCRNRLEIRPIAEEVK